MFATVAQKFNETAMWSVVLEANRRDIEMRDTIAQWRSDDSITVDMGMVVSLSDQAVAIKEMINTTQQTSPKFQSSPKPCGYRRASRI